MTIQPDAFVSAACAAGFSVAVGVPCSLLSGVYNAFSRSPRISFTGATSEGEGVAIAAGAWLAGRSAMMLCQNSGLGNMVNPLTSLNEPFRIPVLLVITWRGEPGIKDEPQHRQMGARLGHLLDALEIRYEEVAADEAALTGQLARAARHMHETRRPFALVLRHGVFGNESVAPADPAARRPGAEVDLRENGVLPSRHDCLRAILAAVDDGTAIIATTGKCGRELFTLADRPQHLYMVGSMGGASATGFGVARYGRRPVLVLDGDGAALMKLGNMATIGAYGADAFTHVILDNQVHDSTGGQATNAATVDFAGVARACNYALALRCDTAEGVRAALGRIGTGSGPALIHCRIAPGSIASLGRPTVPPDAVADRFRSFITAEP